jgi:hypothetical protein
MKKLLFVVAACAFVTLSTTSCKKECSSCSLKTGTVTTPGGKTKEECDALKTTASLSGGNIEVICD